MNHDSDWLILSLFVASMIIVITLLLLLLLLILLLWRIDPLLGRDIDTNTEYSRC
jgi:hypothetical protein